MVAAASVDLLIAPVITPDGHDFSPSRTAWIGSAALFGPDVRVSARLSLAFLFVVLL